MAEQTAPDWKRFKQILAIGLVRGMIAEGKLKSIKPVDEGRKEGQVIEEGADKCSSRIYESQR